MKLDISCINLNNEKDYKELQKYTLWYNYFSFWAFGWFILYKIGLIKIQPSLLFYYIVILFVIIVLIYNINNKIYNYNLIFININIAIILDVVPIFYLSSTNLLNKKENVLMLIYFIIYLIFIKLRFKNENIFNTIFNIYFKYNNISRFKNITIRRYFNLKYYI